MSALIIPRDDAVAFLTKPQPTWIERVVEGAGRQRVKVKLPRHNRGPGGKVSIINYGLHTQKGKLVAVARLGCSPWGNDPVVAAMTEALAPHTAYLMRLCGIGITHDDLVEFVKDAIARFRADTLAMSEKRAKRGKAHHDLRYLLSLDDPTEELIEDQKGNVLAFTRAATGRVYLESGALFGGMTKSKPTPTRWVDQDGRLRSVYQSGVNHLPELTQSGAHLLNEGQKARFVWVLAPGSLAHATWHSALPRWFKQTEWGENDLGWVQPRLLADLLRGLRPDLQPA